MLLPPNQPFQAAGAPDADAPALMVCDRQGRVQSTNAAWSRLFGHPADAVPSLFDAALYLDGDAGVQRLRQALDGVSAAQEPLALHFRRHDGSPFLGRVQCQTLQAGGHTWYSAWITADGPQPPAVPAQGREQELLLDHLLTGAVFIGDGKLLRANATFAQMFGFADADGLAGMEIRRLYEDDVEFQRFTTESERSFVHDGTCSCTWRARRQDGSIFQVYGRGRTVQAPGLRDAAVWTIDDETDLRRAQEARQDNETYSRMLQDSHIAMSIYDPLADCYTDCNESARKLYGLEKREDLLGRNVLSVSAPMQDNGMVSAEMLAMGRKNLQSRGKEMPTFEWRHRRPNGVEWIAEVHGTPFRYRGKTLIQFTVSDITSVKLARRQVEEMAVFLQTMIDRMPNAVYYKGPDTRFLGCNQAFEQAFGVTRADLVGKRVDELDYLPAQMRAELQAEDERVIASATHERREAKLMFADGRVHPVLHSVSGFRKPDGSPGGLVGVTVDLDALKAAESALGVAQKEQAAMFETAGVGIAFLRDGVIARCNRELGSMFGYAVGELEGQRMGIWYGGDADHGEAQERLAQ
uniref:PAS domain-containing protein n=1 Tax=Pseudorhodoferax sp. TaxID=1993553 RepID=UPI002DD6613E